MEAAQSALSADTWAQFVHVCEIIFYAMPFRLFVVFVLVGATIWAIAKVYSGDLQNAEKGPVAIRRHSAGSMPRDTLVVHRSLIDLSMDGTRAKCTFIYVYEGHKGRRQHVKLKSYDMLLSVSATPLRSLLDVARANEVPDVGSQEVYWPILDVETENPVVGEKTPDRARDYARQNKVLERWSGDDALHLISLHQEVMGEVRDARSEFIQHRVDRLRAARSGGWWKRMGLHKAARERPGAVGNYYLKFQFSNDPVFVLTKHPDRDVRMTAWLTLLTSAFALLMEVFPLQVTPPPGVAGAVTAPLDRSVQENSARSPPRVRPP